MDLDGAIELISGMAVPKAGTGRVDQLTREKRVDDSPNGDVVIQNFHVNLPNAISDSFLDRT
jgi:hypothetical protein